MFSSIFEHRVREITHGGTFSSRLIARERNRWRSVRLKSDELFVTSEDTRGWPSKQRHANYAIRCSCKDTRVTIPDLFRQDNKPVRPCWWERKGNLYSLEEIGVIDVSEERYRVGQHPDIATSAVVIRLRPSAILVFHRQDFVLLPFRVHALVQCIGVESWNDRGNHYVGDRIYSFPFEAMFD